MNVRSNNTVEVSSAMKREAVSLKMLVATYQTTHPGR
jgi:hypothetical protein